MRSVKKIRKNDSSEIIFSRTSLVYFFYLNFKDRSTSLMMIILYIVYVWVRAFSSFATLQLNSEPIKKCLPTLPPVNRQMEIKICKIETLLFLATVIAWIWLEIELWRAKSQKCSRVIA